MVFKRKNAVRKKAVSPVSAESSEAESSAASEPEVVSSEEEEEAEVKKPSKKKGKPAPKPKAKVEVKVEAKVKPKVVTPASPTEIAPVKRGPGRPKGPAKKAAKVVMPSPQKPASPEVEPVPKALVIEHCKQCQSFKKTATKLEEHLKAALPELDISMNPEKPRKGVFEVRDASNGAIYLSLTGLVRPFKKMKDLDLEVTASQVIAQMA